MVVVALVVAVAVVIVATLWYLHDPKNRKIVNKLPGPPDLPVIGNAHQMNMEGPEFFQKTIDLAKEFKDYGIFRMWVSFWPEVVIFKAELCEVLLTSTKHMEKSWAYKFLHPWLGTGLLTSSGSKWHERRRMLTPTFHFKILSDFVTVFQEQSEILVNKLNSQVEQESFDIFPYIKHCTLDIICETAMGKQIHAQNQNESEYVTAVINISSILINRMKSPWYWTDFMFNTFGSGKEYKKCLNILHTFTREVIQEKRVEFSKIQASGEETKTKKRLAFMDLLLRMSDDGRVLSDNDIREEVDTFMFEGHDTTAVALNWAVHLIGAHPEVQRKLQEELDRVLGDSDEPITVEILKELQYTECCIKEALRLYPSVPFFGRTIECDVEIGGYLLPKGMAASIQTYTLHRDPRHFPEPEVFNPERFTPENSVGRHPFAYIPFSAGMRNCIGQKFAMMEEKVVLASIFRKFNVTSHQTRAELRPMGDIILRPEVGIFVSLEKRL